MNANETGSAAGRVLEWLLDLDSIELRDSDRLSLQWLEPLDGWMWFILLMVVPCYVFLIYRHDGGTRRRRVIMACGRAAVILLTLLLLSEPAVVFRRDRVEPSTVAVMVDRSASMGRLDHYAGEAREALGRMLPEEHASGVASRWQIVRTLLAQEDHALLSRLRALHEVRWFTFASGILSEGQLDSGADSARVASELVESAPTGSQTDLAGSLEEVFEACVDAHLAGIVLITDGQATTESDWTEVRRLSRSRGTPIYPIVVGSPETPQDVVLRKARADPYLYLGDRTSVHCTLEESGLTPGTPLEVRLHDTAGGVLYAEQVISAQGGEAASEIELQFHPTSAGDYHLVLEVMPLEGEIETTNNAAQLQVRVVDANLKVLYVDGYPRYEYRYLKNTLIREPSISSSVLLLSADREFAQEGNEPIRRFPSTMEELAEYDVVLLGDVDLREGWISRNQMDMVVEFVGDRGGGFGVIAGEWFTPQSLSGTPLERLLAVELEEAGKSRAAGGAGEAYRPQLTTAGLEHPIFRLLFNAGQIESAFDLLPPWFWSYPVRRARPGTEVLLRHPTLGGEEGPRPLVVVGQHGAGRVFYQGSDDSWRWRRYRGEGFFDTYWIQVVRYLGRNKKFQVGSGIALSPQQRQITQQTPVVLSLEFEDVTSAAALPDSVAASVRTAAGVEIAEAVLTRLAANSRHFQGQYIPNTTGQLEILFDPRRYGLEAPAVSTLVDIERMSIEDRRREANLKLMQQLAEITGGRIVEPWQAATAPAQIPDRKYTIPDDITETIWDSKLALILFVVFIATEWTLRKLSGLT